MVRKHKLPFAHVLVVGSDAISASLADVRALAPLVGTVTVVPFTAVVDGDGVKGTHAGTFPTVQAFSQFVKSCGGM